MRDEFAARFAAAICSGPAATMIANMDQRYVVGVNWKQVVAANAYEFADQMLKTRLLPRTKDGDIPV